MQTTYEVQYYGACLGNLVEHGATLTISRTETMLPGDIVALGLHSAEDSPYAELMNSLGADGFAGVCKIFLGLDDAIEGEPVYLVGQLNPPVLSPVPRSAIVSLHKVVNANTTNNRGISARDQEAVRLLSRFGGNPSGPIN